MALQIISFANFDVKDPKELLPEDSNCKKRKPQLYDEKVHKASKYQEKKPIGLDLQSCNLVTINNLQRLVHSCLFYPDQLIYLDLRCNKLQSINGIEQLQTLKILYLHGNDIQSVADLLPLKQMNLDALTVHGNPLVRQHNYKLFIINQLASLKRLDFGGITKRDRLEAAEAQKMNLISLVVNENVDIGRK
ncbi:U2_small nuclear ribonucleoprotein A' putative [Hexamita inflata]|uniref:Leucine-rich repeat-containing protein 51 n=1 Tax=Hexamita inflata TaxID=28002 RepID=A0AA86P4J9_9EUKA|nr:U2 small nuclear ribonucleoprotein A' putative [Hexamita inflata]